MTTQALMDHCLKMNGAYLDHPFGPQLAAVRVGKTADKNGRIFAQFFHLNGIDVVTFSCDVLTGQFYKDLYPDVLMAAYHCPEFQRKYAYTLPVDKLPDAVMCEMADTSFFRDFDIEYLNEETMTSYKFKKLYRACVRKNKGYMESHK